MNSTPALRERIGKLMDAENWRAAVDVATQACEIVWQDAVLSWNVGWAYFKLDELEKAELFMRRAVELDPHDAGSHWGLGVVLSSAARHHDAESCFLQSLRLRETHDARLHLAVMYLNIGRHSDAERVLREGVEVRPDHRERVESLANMLYDLGRTSEAEECYARARLLVPEQTRRTRRRK